MCDNWYSLLLYDGIGLISIHQGRGNRHAYGPVSSGQVSIEPDHNFDTPIEDTIESQCGRTIAKFGGYALGRSARSALSGRHSRLHRHWAVPNREGFSHVPFGSIRFRNSNCGTHCALSLPPRPGPTVVSTFGGQNTATGCWVTSHLLLAHGTEVSANLPGATKWGAISLMRFGSDVLWYRFPPSSTDFTKGSIQSWPLVMFRCPRTKEIQWAYSFSTQPCFLYLHPHGGRTHPTPPLLVSFRTMEQLLAFLDGG